MTNGTSRAGETAATVDVLTRVLEGRRSVGRLLEPAPDEEQMRALVRAALLAPDHGRLRPARFVPLTGEARIAFGAVLADAALARDPHLTEAKLEIERRRLLRAPLVLVVLAEVDPAAAIPVWEQQAAVHAGIENLLLLASAMGFGAVWRTGPAATDPRVRSALGLAEQDEVCGFVYLGTPDAAVQLPPRPEPDVDAALRTWPFAP